MPPLRHFTCAASLTAMLTTLPAFAQTGPAPMKPGPAKLGKGGPRGGKPSAPPPAARSANELRADELFQEANRLVAQGNHDAACPKFEESQALDPGLGTQFNLADCYERGERPVEAFRLFRSVEQAAHAAGKAEREQSAKVRADALEAELAKVTIANPHGATVTLDGASAAGGEVLVAAGPHIVRATAPGKIPWSTKVKVAPGGRAEVNIPPLEAPRPVVEPTEAHGAKRSWELPAAIAIGSAGLLGLGVGAVAGGISLGKNGEASRSCPEPAACNDPAGFDAWSAAVTAGNVSTVAFIAGGVLTAGGVVLLLTRPSGDSSSALGRLRGGVAIDATGAHVRVRGAF